MANTVTKTAIHDGKSIGHVRCYVASDGSSGELSDEVLLDASALAGAKNITQIFEVKGALVGFSAILEFDATADVPFITLPADEDFCFDFNANPIPNNAGSGITGDVTITTNGFTATGDYGWIEFKYSKDSHES